IWMILFSGGDCAEDVQSNLKSELSNILEMKISSADTILRLQKELSSSKEIHISKNNITNEFNNIAVLNKLNLAILLLTN
ncbi:MAG: IS1380 family transposase, partial [Flavobacteriaceae bacterium]|nr:IS1380 family transposase [Flavobacteriaceae bacterium]